MTKTGNLVIGLAAVLASTSVFMQSQTPVAPQSDQNTKIAEAYQQWKRKYGRLYASPKENDYRKDVFTNNYIKVEGVNKQELSYKFSLNKFADLTPQEIQAKYFGLGSVKELQKSRRVLAEDQALIALGNVEPVIHKDWHKEDALNDVLHQGGCGACYSFSTTIALEHLYFLKFNQKIKLSEQELVDCSKGHGNTGCKGGWMHQAFDYVIQNNGMQLASTYPYMAIEGQFCRQNHDRNVKNLLSRYVQIPENNNEMIRRALHNSLVPSAVDARDLAFYSSGVYDNRECGNDINHAIVIVGYGVNFEGKKYWKVRNSWGAEWGSNGYFKLIRDDGTTPGICGITAYNVYPIGA